MADVEVLADPADMSPQERTNELQRVIAADDLLGVLLVLYCVKGNEIDGVSSTTRQTPLEAAISLPTRHAACRQLIVECLLLRGARIDRVLHDPPRQSLPGYIDLLQAWSIAGKDAAREAAVLLAKELEDAESYISQHGLLPDVAGESLEPVDTPPIPSTSSPAAHKRPRTPDNDSIRKSRSSSHSSRVPTVEDGPRRSSNDEPSSRRSRRRSHRTPSPEPTDGLDLPFEAPTHWLFVGNITMSLAERYLYETLDGRGIPPGDVFMSRKPSSGRRFAYIGFYSSRDRNEAVRTLNGTWVHDVRLLAAPFRDPSTGATMPHLAAGSHVLRRYIGPRRQAARPRHLRHVGLFLLHLHPETTEEDVFRFVRRDLPREKIKSIKVKTLGLSTLAFVDSDDEDACRQAIVSLDGRILRGPAVRVGWQELAEVHADALQTTSQAATRSMEDFRTRSGKEEMASPTKRRRLSGDGGSVDTKASRSDLYQSNTSQPTSNPSDAFSPRPILPSPDHFDSSQIHTLGLSSDLVQSIEQVCKPSNELSSHADRSVDFTAAFGFATESDALAALETNKSSPAFPDEPTQRCYEAFLRSQAGLDKDWYMGFFTELVDFNRSTGLFVSKVPGPAPA